MTLIDMTKSNKLQTPGTSRVDARLLLQMLMHISQHGGVGNSELCEVLNLSRATTARMLSNARKQYGVEIVYRRDDSLPSQGEYSIDNWGVFDPVRIKKFLQKKL
ncbi:MAG: hypothetical protein WC236_15920 [Gallionellaceae bacterium]